MDPTKVDPILRYAMAVAAHEDDPWDRRLGAIHLLKFVYLADLAYSERHAGQTFTGAEWRFYHYGPWAAPVFDRIKPVIEGLDVEEHRFAGTQYENDSVRWSLSEDEDPDEIIARHERDLPIEVAGRVKWAVHQFGHDTAALLHYVYTTPPMTRAAPNETLRFEAVEPAVKREVVQTEELSVRAQKKQRQAVEALRNQVQERLRAALSRRDQESAGLPPRYDDVFVQGQKWLDEHEEANVDSLEGEVEFELSATGPGADQRSLRATCLIPGVAFGRTSVVCDQEATRRISSGTRYTAAQTTRISSRPTWSSRPSRPLWASKLSGS